MEMEITAHEPEEDVVNTLEEIEKDVQSLTEGLIEVRAQRLAKNVLMKQKLQLFLTEIITNGVCKNKEEALERAIESFFVAVIPESRRKIVLSQEY
ncbi:hypothetical protein FJZ31_09695 [Candidatus Poribacteria bacterium]|nr:hypothetical protein [Candidatus Poribacteria bacterium]